MSKQAAIFFPFRSPPTGGQPKLPACRAWRIIARSSGDFGADKSIVAAGEVPQAPAGCRDGAYPVWIKSTLPNGQDIQGYRLIDGDGWHADPQGPGWRIEYVGAGTVATEQFSYVVEFIPADEPLDIAGQINTAQSSGLMSEVSFGPYTQAIGPGVAGMLTFNFQRPAWAKNFDAWFQNEVLAGLGQSRWLVYDLDQVGNVWKRWGPGTLGACVQSGVGGAPTTLAILGIRSITTRTPAGVPFLSDPACVPPATLRFTLDESGGANTFTVQNLRVWGRWST